MPHSDSGAIGRRIAEARSRAQLTQDDLARAAGMGRSALAKVETGQRRVTVLELARIAEQTGERIDWFVLDPPPALVSYRHADTAVTTSTIERLLEQIARDVTMVQSLRPLPAVSFTPFAPPGDHAEATELAADARQLLGLAEEGPVTDLLNRAADFGLYAFARDLGPESPDAATTLLENGGVSVINSDRAVGRRRLALAHELGHYLVADEYTVDWRVGAVTGVDRLERRFDAFARAFLLPASSVSHRWRELTQAGSVREAAVRVASEYRVDMATLAARLSDLRLADDDALARVRETTTTRSDIIEYDLVVAQELEGTALPRRYEKEVLALYKAERINAARAMELLHDTIDESGLPELPPVSEDEIWKFIS